MLIYGSGIAVDLLISDPVVSVRNVVLCAIKILGFIMDDVGVSC